MFKKIAFVFLLFILSSSSFALKDICVDNKCLGAELYKGIENALKNNNGQLEAVTKKRIVENFCKVIKQFDVLPYKQANAYKVKDSLFLQLLCTSVGDESFDAKLDLKENKLKYYKNLIKEAKSVDVLNNGESLFGKCGKTNGVSTDPDSMNNVDFVCVSKDVFDTVISDYTDMASFVAYGGFGTEEKMKKWEKDFFAGKDSVCKDSYIDSEDDEKLYCKHPLVKQYLFEQSSKLKSMIKNLKIIKIEPDDIYTKFSVNTSKNDPGAVLMNLKDRAYNELYFYRVFLAYYASSLRMYNQYVSLKKTSSDMEELFNLDNSDEVLTAKQYIGTSGQALFKTFDAIKNIYRTYPLHIGFLALIEDFDKLRDALTYVYTPIDQMRYKLEQSQNKKY